MELFDTHCHLDFSQFDDDRDDVLKRMREHGITRAVTVAVDLDHIPALQALATENAGIWYSVGIHPNHSVVKEPSVDELCELATGKKCVAIGETGLDFFRHHVDPEQQILRFRTHIRAAKTLNKPVIIHMREADQATLDVMREEKIEACGGIMHCFSSTLDVANKAMDMGMSISFSGNVTFKKNDELREVAQKIPVQSMLIETDSPYLTPAPYRGKRNEPTYVLHIAECIAKARDLSVETLADQTTENGCRRFSLPA
ncbi:MAG: TatD family hydrolase [Mariprofundaceae bacterium]